MKKKKSIEVFNALYQLVYPNLCLHCNQKTTSNKEPLCTHCLIDLTYAHFYKSPNENRLEKLFWGRVNIKNTYTAFLYKKGNAVAKMVQALKYKNQPRLGEALGRLLAHEILKYDTYSKPEALIPVPLHPKKEFKRGYNQSKMLANGLEEELNIAVNDIILKRNVHNVTQTKKHQFERWDNVSKIFTAHKISGINHVMVIDDVVTTGATLEAAVQALIDVGYQVSIATFAITTLD